MRDETQNITHAVRICYVPATERQQSLQQGLQWLTNDTELNLEVLDTVEDVKKFLRDWFEVIQNMQDYSVL